MSDAKLVISIEDDGGQPQAPPPEFSRTPPTRQPDGTPPTRQPTAQLPEKMVAPSAGRVAPPGRETTSSPSRSDRPDVGEITIDARDVNIRTPDGGGESAAIEDQTAGDKIDLRGVKEFDESIGKAGIARKVEDVGEKFGEFNGALERATSGLLGLPAKIILTQVLRQVANSALDMLKVKKEDGPQDVRVINFDEIGGTPRPPEERQPSGTDGAAETADEGHAETPEGARSRFDEWKQKGKEKFEQAKEKGQDLLDKGKEKIGQAKEKGKELLDKGKEKGRDLLDRGKEHGQQIASKGKTVAGKGVSAVGSGASAVGGAAGRIGGAASGAATQATKAAKPMASRAGAMIGAGGVAAAGGAARIGVAAAGAAVPVATGAISAAASGVLALASAAPPAAIAIAAVAGAAITAKLAWDLFSKTLGAEVEKLKEVSGSVAVADANTELRREMATIRRGKEIGPQVAEFENLRSRFEDSSYRLGTEIKQILGDIFQTIQPMLEIVSRLFESGVEIFGALNDLNGIVRDLASFKFQSALERVAKIEAHTKAAAMALMKDSDDFSEMDPFFNELLAHAGALGVNVNLAAAGPAGAPAGPAAAPVMPAAAAAPPAANPAAPPVMAPTMAQVQASLGPIGSAPLHPLPGSGGGQLIQPPSFWKNGGNANPPKTLN